jgi:hypothetical protein
LRQPIHIQLAISAGSVLTNQLLRRRIEALPAPLIGQTLKGGEGLPASLAHLQCGHWILALIR